jgi:hypothetical protein
MLRVYIKVFLSVDYHKGIYRSIYLAYQIEARHHCCLKSYFFTSNNIDLINSIASKKFKSEKFIIFDLLLICNKFMIIDIYFNFIS